MTGMAAELGHIDVDRRALPAAAATGAASSSTLPPPPLCAWRGGHCQRKRSGTVSRGQSVGCRIQRQNRCTTSPSRATNPRRDIFNRVGWALGILGGRPGEHALNLNMYVIGGGVSCGVGKRFRLSSLKNFWRRSLWCMPLPLPTSTQSLDGAGASGHVGPEGPTKTIVTRALLGSDAGRYGAAQLPTDEQLEIFTFLSARKSASFCSGLPIVMRMDSGAPHCSRGRTKIPSSRRCSAKVSGVPCTEVAIEKVSPSGSDRIPGRCHRTGTAVPPGPHCFRRFCGCGLSPQAPPAPPPGPARRRNTSNVGAKSARSTPRMQSRIPPVRRPVRAL